jgi:group I intron endonuclease
MERKYCVYVHTFPNGKKYVGITSKKVNVRWQNGTGYRRSQLVRNAIEKYGWENVEHEVILTDLTEEEAYQAEKDTIAKLKTIDIHFGYNMNSGGKDYYHSELSIKRMSGKNHYSYGRTEKMVMSEEAKRKIGLANSGERHYLFGKHLSDEHRKNVSISLTGEKNGFYGKKHKEGIFAYRRRPIYQIDLETKEIIKLWNSAWEIEETLGYGHSAIAACCRGKYQTSRGYLWKYAN